MLITCTHFAKSTMALSNLLLFIILFSWKLQHVRRTCLSEIYLSKLELVVFLVVTPHQLGLSQNHPSEEGDNLGSQQELCGPLSELLSKHSFSQIAGLTQLYCKAGDHWTGQDRTVTIEYHKSLSNFLLLWVILRTNFISIHSSFHPSKNVT